MIWMDAAPERPVAATLIKDALATVLHLDTSAIEVVHDLSQAEGKAAICVIRDGDGSNFSQTISVYIDDGLTRPGLLEGGSMIAEFVRTAMLLPDDETADPYSFVLAPGSSPRVNVLVDRNQLDRHDRYVIVEYGGGHGCVEGSAPDE